MRLSKSFWQTYKETPADAEISSHRLMMRSGMIHKSGAGLYSYLPMGYRSVRKAEQIIREEMDKANCHELLMSVVTPGELWQESGRWDKMGGEMLKFQDKGGRDLCISPTNEETVTDIFRKTVKSYKNMPVTLYQINTKFRDEIRPRFGLMRSREFTMKDAYSFHMDKVCLDEVYESLFKAYEKIFNRMGLEFSAVEADAGAMGNSESKSHEFQVIADSGEDEVVYCAETGYASNIEKAKTLRPLIDFFITNDAMESVDTPDVSNIESVCNLLKVPQYQSLKSLVYKAVTEDEEKFVLVITLGDDNLNELKLQNSLACDDLKPATDNELESIKMIKGSIGPVNLDSEIQVIFDEAINMNASYYVGANIVNKHFKNYMPKRDTETIQQVDLRMACAGDLTEDKKGTVEIKRGIEVGHIFQLGDKYTSALNVKILDNNGKTQTPLMGCYGIGVTRVVAAAVEQNHDSNGIVWPISLAPYHVYFTVLAKSDETKEICEKIYKQLLVENVEVVMDDRKAGPGFKFKDADLLGLPLQLVLGERDFKEDGMLEIRVRNTGEKIKVKPEEAVSKLKEMIKVMM